MKLTKKIIIAAHDAGGMDSLIPVIGKLFQDSSYEVTCLVHGPAKKLLDQRQYRYADADTLSDAELEMLVVDVAPDVILTGTSSGLTIEKKLLKIAQAKKIPTVAIIDFWINYNLQFSFAAKGKAKAVDLPDLILVMDDLAKREMIAEGFPEEKIVITGNPHFESFKIFPPPPVENQNIVFIDQGFSGLYHEGFHENMGFDEIEVMRDLIRALSEMGFAGKVIVKFHPATQNRAKYDALVKPTSIKIELDSKDTLEKSLAESRLVVGMTSMALFEAALGGKIVISYQPHPARLPDPLISNRLGLSHFAYNYGDFKKILTKTLLGKAKQEINQSLIDQYTKNHATLKVIEEIEKLIAVKKD